MSKQAINRFVFVAHAEGVSFLILLFIAMPLKYIFEIPEAVKIVGMLHGLLFVAFGIMLIYLWILLSWSFLKTLKLFILSFIPFGTFYIRKLI
jgi:integral membrane protein